ncbi:MAG: hypothetical protein CMA25_05475 [Euryarchaeota archaeon]|nr:hypothetical protein [Euryarchaeota archaeon]
MRRPELNRDSGWLIGVDLLVVFLGLIGQVFLSRSLLSTDYGLLIILLDAFATIFILIDAGLPTLLNRDGPKAPGMARTAAHRILKLQAIIALPFIIIAFIGSTVIWGDLPIGLLSICAAITLMHVASYPHRSLLRCLGEARLEAVTKLLERTVTTCLYGCLMVFEVNEIQWWALAFFIGAMLGLISAVIFGERVGKSNQGEGVLPELWNSNKTLLMGALPFAVTLGVLPYVTKLEKFLLSYYHSYEDVALFHVAQLAWLAGLLVPQGVRAALLPVLGEARTQEQVIARMSKAQLLGFILLPLGLFFGHILVSNLIPLAFSTNYVQAVEIFDILLAGWALTLLAVPWYVGLQAGPHPWRFTGLLGLVVLSAFVSGIILIPQYGVTGAAWASVCGSFVMFYASRWMNRTKLPQQIWLDISALTCLVTGYFLSTGSRWAWIGLITMIPASLSIAEIRHQMKISEEE